MFRPTLLSAALLALGFALSGASASAAEPAGAVCDLKWLDKRIQECQPRPDERKFDQIGWLTDIRSAQKLAREHNRPLFLFTHDGQMATGRC